jgi:YihY family inner membrane protein
MSAPTETTPLDHTVDHASASAEAIANVVTSKWFRWRKDGTVLVKYLLDSEVHTFAFSVAANAILSFIPFLVLLYTLSRRVFRSDTMAIVLDDMVKGFLPADLSDPTFITRGLHWAAASQGVQFFSIVMILVACTGIFLPLEVALNQAWGITKSRNYIMNQIVAFGLALIMVVLALLATLVSAGQRVILGFLFFHHIDNFVYRGISGAWLAIATGIASILFFFCVYWLLPNRKIPPSKVMRTSIYTGAIWLAAKYLFAAILPHLDLESLYRPFQVSVGLLLWAYISGLILFAGAQFSVSRMGNGQGQSGVNVEVIVSKQ